MMVDSSKNPADYVTTQVGEAGFNPDAEHPPEATVLVNKNSIWYKFAKEQLETLAKGNERHKPPTEEEIARVANNALLSFGFSLQDPSFGPLKSNNILDTQGSQSKAQPPKSRASVRYPEGDQ